ncbi:hypothetical protein [Pontibacter chitinilyticus]|uniref:hypothetical protein n=1 Tax=Pontibacter chitinilyticus TaxID=2674989 RepID=UPI00321A0A08
MSKFITGKELEDAVYNIIWEANRDLMIMSPYIKLDDYFKKLFEKHLNNPKLHITIVFGKNEGQVDKSFRKADLDFFMQFPNISLVYVPTLHAKYYANDLMGVLTSINLYDYSFRNNIEFGVLYESKGFGLLSKNPDTDIWEATQDIANDHEVVYVKRPVFEKGFLSKTYMSSRILLDRTAELYSSKPLQKGKIKLEDFEEELDHVNQYSDMPIREKVETRKLQEKKAGFTYKAPKPAPQKDFEPGYCIRTGVKIEFNPERPLSYQAFKSWNQFGNEDYEERFCHYSGEPSNGETSVSRPILRKNWKKAKLLMK